MIQIKGVFDSNEGRRGDRFFFIIYMFGSKEVGGKRDIN